MEKVANLLSKIPYVPNIELKLAIIGVIALLAVFLIALIFTAGSRIKKMSKQLIKSTRVINGIKRIDEENVDIVTGELTKLPEPANKGWERFMDKRQDYPSDYMSAKEVFSDRKFSGKHTVAMGVFVILGLAILAVVAYFTTMLCAGDMTKVGLKDFIDEFGLVSSIICTFLIPALFYVIFILSLKLIFNTQIDRLNMTYASFMEVLDDRVIIYASDEEEFVSENLEQVTKSVEDIVQGRLLEDEVVDVITVPTVIDEEYEVAPTEAVATVEEVSVENDVAVEEPIEEDEYIEEVVAVEEPMTKEEEQRYLVVLAQIVDEALNDKSVSDKDLEKIAVLINNAKERTFKDESDQEILGDCLYALASRYFEE